MGGMKHQTRQGLSFWPPWLLWRSLRVVGRTSWRDFQQTLKLPIWQWKCLGGWHLGKCERTPFDYIEQHRKIKIMAGSGKSLFLLLLPITLCKTHSELPKCIFTTEVRILVTKRRHQWLSVAVLVAFGDNAHFDNNRNWVVMVILLIATLANSMTTNNEFETNESTFGSCRS